MIRLALLLSLIAAPAFAQGHAGHAMPAANTGGHDMKPVDVTGAPMAMSGARGGQDLPSRLVGGVREFELTAGVVQWHILPNVMVGAFAYNGQVPGPTIRARPGERLRLKVTNGLTEPTTVHWHGIDVPFDQDGVPGMSQPPIPPGGSFTYAFTVPATPGTFLYHTHTLSDRQQALGLYGAFVIETPHPRPTPRNTLSSSANGACSPTARPCRRWTRKACGRTISPSTARRSRRRTP